jgi:hypothetical protein
MKTEFNRAANDSPRSGSPKKISPVVGAMNLACRRRGDSHRDHGRALVENARVNECAACAGTIHLSVDCFGGNFPKEDGDD